MNKKDYKLAIDNIQFSDNLSEKTIDYLSSYNLKANNEIAYKKTKSKKSKIVIALVFCISALLIIIPVLNNKNYLDLPNSQGNISAKYIKEVPSISAQSDLEWLTEEELFNKYNTDVFMGIIEEIKNIEIDYNGSIDYRAIAKINVNKVYMGNLKPGETALVLLPSPIGTNIVNSDSDIISSMKIGMTGIFMPMKYDDTSYREENGARLYLKDIAEYGLADGMRYVFLSTENGLIFERSAYESIGFATTLEEVEQYIIKMIE